MTDEGASRSRRSMTFGLAAQQPLADAADARQGRPASRHPERDGDLRQRQAALRAGRHRRAGRVDRLHRTARRDAEPGADAADDAAIVGHGDRRHRQVRDAGHRQRAHALARGAAARHAAADPVRAEPLSRRRRDDGARGRRRLRQIEALAGREQRAHDHRAAHPRLSVRQQGADRIAGRDPRLDPRHQAEGGGRPQDHRHGSRPARSDHGRSAQARAAHGDAHRGRGDDGEGLRRARRQLDRALLRRRGRGARTASRTSRPT